MPDIENHNFCLIAIYLKVIFKGNLRRHALICLPEASDVYNWKALYEPPHKDPNEKLRRHKKFEHVKYIKHMRRQSIKLKKKGIVRILIQR